MALQKNKRKSGIISMTKIEMLKKSRGELLEIAGFLSKSDFDFEEIIVEIINAINALDNLIEQEEEKDA